MVPEALLDTDILSEILKGRDPNVERRKNVYPRDHQTLLFTSVTVMEVMSGLHYKNALVQIARAEWIFNRNVEIVPDKHDYHVAAEIVGKLALRGTPIGVSDPLMAACAVNRDLILATGNTRHHAFIQNAGFPLRIEDWRRT